MARRILSLDYEDLPLNSTIQGKGARDRRKNEGRDMLLADF